jgi:hypothetical protein
MNDAPLNVDDLNQAWSTLLSQLVTSKLILEKQVQQLHLENNGLLGQNKDLRAELHKAQANLLAAQGKTAIDQATKEKSRP